MRKLRKWFHRWVLDSLIINPPPIIIVLLCVFGSVFSIGFLFAHWIDELTLTNYRIYDIMSDNIGGYPALNIMNNLLPIDVVYTWVNGSDPYVTENLKKVSEFEKTSCLFDNCFPSSYYAAELLDGKHAKIFSNTHGFLQTLVVHSGNRSKQFALFHKSQPLNSGEYVKYLESHLNDSASFQQAFWTSDQKVQWSVAWKKGLIIRIDQTSEIHVEISKSSPENYSTFFKLCSLTDFFPVFIVECASESLITKLIEDIEKYSSTKSLKFPKVWKASLILNSHSVTKDLTINRFEENEELRYSLRSIEKYAPWVRRIFLVTNGQIPHWLNLDHPRISIVTHSQIFPNSSHLPTFSSPAIESHIHRIPGLSEHFLYLNDDVMLGDFVWPDDFYTPSKGYKVYLAWSLPECSSGCPGSWISDGYCDHACNISACSFDGGDCVGAKDQLERDGGSFFSDDDPFAMDSEFCSSSCSDSWLADSYCDAACSTPVCGFDAGDCGLEIIKENLLQLPFDLDAKENITLTIPRGVLSAWLDIKPLLEMEKNSTFRGSYTNTNGIRIATVNIPLGALIFVLKFNVTGIAHVEFGYYNQEKEAYTLKRSIFIKFNTNPVNFTTYVDESFSLPDSVQAKDVKDFSFKESYPKISNSTYLFDRDDLSFNYSDTVLTKELISEVKILHDRYVNGELTDKGFKMKKIHLMRSHSHPVASQQKNQAERNDKNKSFNYFSPNRSLLSVNSRRLLELRKQNNDTKPTSDEQNHNGHFYRKSMDLNSDGGTIRRGPKILDSYGESLLYVNQIYNTEYGYHARRVPAHMPLFINKEIIQGLQNKFSHEFDLTSSHKFRQWNDMQFSFSYFYYLMSEQKQKTVGEIFDDFDTDMSGTWADREIRTFLTRTSDLPLYYQSFAEIHSEIKNCSQKFESTPVSTPLYERYADSDVPTVSKQLIEKCSSPALRRRLKKLEKVSKFHFSVVSDSAVHFKMMKSNISSVVYQLDDVRKNARKFICMNQDMDPKSKDNDLVKALIQDTYEALLPIPSAFELPPNYRNRFAYTWQLEEWKRRKNFIRSLIYAFLSCFIILTLAVVFSHEIEAMKRRWCKRRRRKDDRSSVARV